MDAAGLRNEKPLLGGRVAGASSWKAAAGASPVPPLAQRESGSCRCIGFLRTGKRPRSRGARQGRGERAQDALRVWRPARWPAILAAENQSDGPVTHDVSWSQSQQRRPRSVGRHPLLACWASTSWPCAPGSDQRGTDSPGEGLDAQSPIPSRRAQCRPPDPRDRLRRGQEGWELASVRDRRDRPSPAAVSARCRRQCAEVACLGGGLAVSGRAVPGLLLPPPPATTATCLATASSSPLRPPGESWRLRRFSLVWPWRGPGTRW